MSSEDECYKFMLKLNKNLRAHRKCMQRLKKHEKFLMKLENERKAHELFLQNEEKREKEKQRLKEIKNKYSDEYNSWVSKILSEPDEITYYENGLVGIVAKPYSSFENYVYRYYNITI